MRSCLVVAVVLVSSACSDKLPSPPDPQAYQAMTEEQKCDAVAPRGARCVDELMVAHLRSLDANADPELLRAMESEMRDRPSSGDEADTMHHLNCVGSRGTAFADAVIACWNTTPCEAFANCVTTAESRPAHRN